MIRSVLLFFFVASVAFAQAQEQPIRRDAQLWENINIEKDFNKSWSAGMCHEGRFTSNMNRFTYYFEDFGLTYKLKKQHLHFSIDYVFIRKEVMPGFWSTRHQYYADMVYKHKLLGGLEMNNRLMLMGQVKDIFSSRDGRYPADYLRDKLTLRYNFSFYYALYAASELYYLINTNEELPADEHFNRVRYFVGGYYRPNLRHEFELYFMHERHFNQVPAVRNFVYGIGYTFSL
jgi:hypothetical protein